MIVPISDLCMCPVCGEYATLHKTRDDNQMCHPCLEHYEAFCDREALEALAPWLRIVTAYARRQ